jgi:hypothetical protein
MPTPSLLGRGQDLANRGNRSCLLAGDFLVNLSTSLVTDVSEDDARRRSASRVPQMCPECVRVFSGQTTTKCRFAGTLLEPSGGLEPSTPPYHLTPAAISRNPRQRIWLICAPFALAGFATDCHWLRLLGSISAPSFVLSVGNSRRGIAGNGVAPLTPSR